jgi:hypothetical protein
MVEPSAYRSSSPAPPPRRNSLPSIVLGPAENEALDGYWSKDEQGSVGPDALRSNPLQPRTPSPLIGLAITSNTGMRTIQQKRRSRSADALYHTAMAHQQGLLRADLLSSKDAEIQYWKSASYRISEATAQVPYNVRQSQAGSIGEVSAVGKAATPSQLTPDPTSDVFGDTEKMPWSQAKAQNRGSRGSRNSMERGSQTSPHFQLQEVTVIDRVDKRLSQIEQNMAHLAQSMQTISDREGGPAPAPKKKSSSTTFRLEKPPPSRVQLSKQHSGHKVSASLGATVHPLHANPGPSLLARQQKQQSPRHVQSAGHLVARSISVKQPVTTPQPRYQHARHSPSLNDLQSRPLGLSDEDLPTAVAVPYDGTSPLPSRLASSLLQHQRRQDSKSNLREASPPGVFHNFSTPFPPPSPTPVTPPTNMATRGTDNSGSTNSSFGAHKTATELPPPRFATHPHQRAQSSSSYLATGLLPSQQLPAPPFAQTEDSPTRFVDHLAPVYSALRHERTVRKALEVQVQHLKRDLYELSSVVAGLVAAQPRDVDDDDDQATEYWEQQGRNFQHRGSASSGRSRNAFAQAQARAQAQSQAALGQADIQHDSLVAQYAAALHQEHAHSQRRRSGQRVSWSDEQQQAQEEGYEAETNDDDDEEEDEEDDLYERSGNWVAAARPVTAPAVATTSSMRTRFRGRSTGVQDDDDWQGDMF